MNELIKINQSEFNGEFVQTVEARIFYESLGLNIVNWSRWSQANIENSQFAVEGEDWQGFFIEKNGNQTTDYVLTLDFAKRLAMMAKTDKGEEVRKYFIACEKQLKTAEVHFLIPKTLPEALRLAADLADKNILLEKKIEADAPKVEFHDKVCEAVNGQTIQEVAKVLGTGQNRMFGWLRREGLLMPNNQPYQEFIDRGYFRVTQRQYTDQRGESHTYTRTLVTGKGLSYVQKRFMAEAA